MLSKDLLPATYFLRDKMCNGNPIFVIGGGPSFDPKAFPWDKRLAIGCNAAYKWHPTMVISSDVRFFREFGERPDFVDCPSLKLYHDLHPDRYNYPIPGDPFRIRTCGPRVWSDSVEKGLVHETHTGMSAINLAALLTTGPIYLLGFDLHVTNKKVRHWHDEYPDNWRMNDCVYTNFREVIERHAHHIKDRCWNLNPDSALKCFEFKDLEEALQ